MTPEQKAAYVQAQAVCAMAELFAMRAHDELEVSRGGNQIHTEEAYRDVLDRYSIRHNAVASIFEDT